MANDGTDGNAAGTNDPGTGEKPSDDQLAKFGEAMKWADSIASKATGSGGSEEGTPSEVIGTSAAVAVGGLFESGTLALSQAMFGSVGNMQQAAILSQASTAANIRKMLSADSSNSTNDTLKLIESVMVLLNRQSNDNKIVIRDD